MSQAGGFWGKLKRALGAERAGEIKSWLSRSKEASRVPLDLTTAVAQLAAVVCKQRNNAVVYVHPFFFAKTQVDGSYAIFATLLNRRETRLLKENPKAMSDAEVAFGLFGGFERLSPALIKPDTASK